MLVQLRDFPDDLAEKLKSYTWRNTASGACLEALLRYPGLLDRVNDMDLEIDRLRRIVARQQQVLDQARDAAALLVEACGQGDLFMSKELKNG